MNSVLSLHWYLRTMFSNSSCEYILPSSGLGIVMTGGAVCVVVVIVLVLGVVVLLAAGFGFLVAVYVGLCGMLWVLD